MARELTEQQQKFLAVLFDEAGGDVLTAKKLAGYSDTTSTTQVVASLKEEILAGLDIITLLLDEVNKQVLPIAIDLASPQ